MSANDPTTGIEAALTKASLGKIPPQLRIATGYDEHVMLFLLRVGNAKSAGDILMEVISLSESDAIVRGFSETGGLIRKELHVDDAQKIKERLELTGTAVEFVKPDEIEQAGH